MRKPEVAEFTYWEFRLLMYGAFFIGLAIGKML